MHAVGIRQNSAAQLSDGQADGPGGVSLHLDDLVSALHYHLVGFLPVLGVTFRTHLLVEIGESDAGDIYSGPYWNYYEAIY